MAVDVSRKLIADTDVGMRAVMARQLGAADFDVA